jgi:hypothetical protein
MENRLENRLFIGTMSKNRAFAGEKSQRGQRKKKLTA